MKYLSRRHFLKIPLGALLLSLTKTKGVIPTVTGLIELDDLGCTLAHEHFLVDFIGADLVAQNQWDAGLVSKVVLPYLKQAKERGVKSIFDCTPAFLGRNIELLKILSRESGIQIITNTGFYGARENKFLPSHAFEASAEDLAREWIKEFSDGIDGTGIKPGFIKIGVDASERLSAMHAKLTTAAALTHLKTGLTICSHTGIANIAFEQMEILRGIGISPRAFVWVHAQAEKDKSMYVRAARQGCWISLDGIGWGQLDEYAEWINELKSAKYLHKVLISHDAGWYEPGKPSTPFQPYTNIFDELIPRLKKKGFRKKDFDQLLIENPKRAFGMGVKWLM